MHRPIGPNRLRVQATPSRESARAVPQDPGPQVAPEDSGQPRWHAPGLDVLRFTLFLSVWLQHNIGRLPATHPLGQILVDASRFGGFGVVGFFTLSSYLITRLLLIERANTGRIRLGAYWWRRILRIWPLYFLLLAVTVTAGAAGVPGAAPARPSPYYLSYLTFTLNWAAPVLAEPINFLTHTWSIGVEEQVYLLLPVLAVLGATGRWRILVTLAALGPLARLLTVQAGLPYPTLWNATTSHLDAIVIGTMLATLQQHHGRIWRLLRGVLAGRRGSAALAVGLILLVLLGAVDYPQIYMSWFSVGSYLLVSLLTAGAIVVAQDAHCASRPTHLLGSLGRRTYGLYMYHWPVLLSIVALDELLGRRFGPVELACSLALTVALALASYELFEKRFLALRRRFQWVVSD